MKATQIAKSNVQAKKKRRSNALAKNAVYLVMILPAMVMSIMFHDVPMFGIQLAFKDYTFRGGIFGSKWVGFRNFQYFFETDQLSRLLGNTLFYSISQLLIVNIVAGVIGALLMYEIRKKGTMKLLQTSTMLPNFISVVAVSYILYLILNPTDIGLVNTIRRMFGMGNIDPYNLPKIWPWIILGIRLWQMAGMAALYNFGALIAIDPALYEAAVIDGANWWQKTRYVSMPGMSGMICMTLITQAANLMNSSLQQMYLTMNSGALLETTDVIAAYVYRGITGGQYGPSSAIGLFTSAVGTVLVIGTNLIIKRIDPEKSLF